MNKLNRINRLRDALRMNEGPEEKFDLIDPLAMEKMNQILAELDATRTPDEVAAAKAKTKALMDSCVKAVREARAKGELI